MSKEGWRLFWVFCVSKIQVKSAFSRKTHWAFTAHTNEADKPFHFRSSFKWCWSSLLNPARGFLSVVLGFCCCHKWWWGLPRAACPPVSGRDLLFSITFLGFERLWSLNYAQDLWQVVWPSFLAYKLGDNPVQWGCIINRSLTEI